MMPNGLHTRRDFLRTTLLGGALTWTVPSFFHLTMRALHAEALNTLTQQRTGRDDTILVVLQLAGGNDGLNTLVPWQNDWYYQARPRLAIPQGDVLKLNDELGFHPAMSGLHALYESGRLAIVQGVGYPNPNRSHFRSMEIWQTATDADHVSRQGWLGRFFDHQCAGMDATAGIHFGNNPPQAFTAKRPKGVAMQTRGPSRRSPETDYVMMAGLEEEIEEAGGSIDLLGGTGMRPADESPLDFLERTKLDAQVSADQINAALRRQPEPEAYPRTRIARDLRMISRLIAGGMTTRIYYVSQGGYDTHAGQKNAHSRLLGEFSEAMHAFVTDLEQQGNADRVLTLTFSEFGRRVGENANQGTDHGAAAPVFITGGNVTGGLYARMPSLAPQDLDRGDLRHSSDFRSVYATILEKHLGAAHTPILGRAFPLLDFI